MNNDNKPVRVLQVIGIMNRGGAEAMIMNLYREIDKNKVQFDFVENSFEPAVFDDEILSLGGKIYRCPHFNGKNYFEYKKWWKDFFDSHSSDYVAVHGHIGSTAAIYLGEAKKHGLFTIAHSHSTNVNKSIKGVFYSILSYPVRYVADYLFACSNDAAINRYGKRMSKSENSKILNNAIDTNDFSYNVAIRDKVRKNLGLNSDTVCVGHVGRMDKYKNQTFVISVFYELLKLNSNSKLVLVGDGENRKHLEKMTEKLRIKDNVIFTGVRSDVNQLLQAMDVFVFPSLFEGLPVTVIEAETAGTPCVISNTIPKECILVDSLVTVKDLNESPSEWAKHILERAKEGHCDYQQEIINKGYDIKTTAKWLEEFYIVHGQR